MQKKESKMLDAHCSIFPHTNIDQNLELPFDQMKEMEQKIKVDKKNAQTYFIIFFYILGAIIELLSLTNLKKKIKYSCKVCFQ